MSAHALSMLIFVAGVLHLGITSAGVTTTLVLDWRRNLAPLCRLTRQIIWTHGAFVLMTIVGFGALSLTCSGRLASGEPLARAICGFIAIFWGLRLLVGAFVFDAKPYLSNSVLKISYASLNLVLVYFVLCYGAAAIA